jgi:hypothetical protein
LWTAAAPGTGASAGTAPRFRAVLAVVVQAVAAAIAAEVDLSAFWDLALDGMTSVHSARSMWQYCTMWQQMIQNELVVL